MELISRIRCIESVRTVRKNTGKFKRNCGIRVAREAESDLLVKRFFQLYRTEAMDRIVPLKTVDGEILDRGPVST